MDQLIDEKPVVDLTLLTRHPTPILEVFELELSPGIRTAGLPSTQNPGMELEKIKTAPFCFDRSTVIAAT